MTIVEQINRIKTNISDTYSALEEKGVTLPEAQNSDNLVECVESITGGGSSDDSELVSLIDRSITSISNENVTSVGGSAFYSCSSLKSVDLPNVTSVGSSAFYSCSSLKSVDLPNVTSIGVSAFYKNTHLSTLNLPNATSIGSNTFSMCNVLKIADLPNVTSIGTYAFSNEKASVSSTYRTPLTTLILRNSTEVCTLASTNALAYTNIHSSTTGCIYVPDDLVDSYKTATNWSTFASRIKPLSEYEIEEA